MSHKTAVLYFHRINSLPTDIHNLCVQPQYFEQQLKYLKEHYNILRFEEDWTQSDRDSVVITFDDGYFDNYEKALPILDKLDIPATFFITSEYLFHDKEFWWDELETIILRGDSYKDNFILEDERYGGCKWNTRDYAERKNFYDAIRTMMLEFTDYEKRTDWLKQLWLWRGVEPFIREENRTITPEICIKMSQNKLITIGCHTLSHPQLSSHSYKEQLKEIGESKRKLEEILNMDVTTMSYPHGKWNEDSVRACKQAGIIKSATTKPLIWTPEISSFEIPRYCIGNYGVMQLKACMDALFADKK